MDTQEKTILWLLVDAENSSYHGYEVSRLHKELKRRKVPEFRKLLSKLREKGFVRIDPKNRHHKSVYKILPPGCKAIGA